MLVKESLSKCFSVYGFLYGKRIEDFSKISSQKNWEFLKSLVESLFENIVYKNTDSNYSFEERTKHNSHVY